VTGAWKNVLVRHVESNIEGDPTLGGSLGLRADVALGGLRASDVEVQAVYGSVDADNRLNSYQLLPLLLAEERDGAGVFAGEIPLSKAGPFGYTVRVLPAHPLLASGAELGLIATPSQL
jgi:starch phosphorylase